MNKLSFPDDHGAAVEQIRHMLKICRDLSHHRQMFLSVYLIDVAMQSLGEKDQSVAVPLVDRSNSR